MGGGGGIFHSIGNLISDTLDVVDKATGGLISDLFDEEQDISDISFSKLFPDDSRVYETKFLNANIQYKSTGINPFTNLLYQKINFLNGKQFEKLGLATKVTGIVYGLNATILEAYLEQNGICDSPTINNITEENIYLLKLIDILSSNNKYSCVNIIAKEPTSNGDYSITFNATDINGNVYYPSLDDNGYIINDGYTYTMIKLNVENSESFTGDGSTTDFTLTDSDKIYTIVSVTVDDVETDYTVSNICIDGTTITFSEPPADGSNIVIDYEYLDTSSTTTEQLVLKNYNNTFSASYNCNGDTYYLYMFTDDVADKISEQTFMFVPIKHSGSFIGTTKAQNLILRELGIDYNSLTHSLSNSTVKDALVSMYTTRTNILYNDIFDVIYGTSKNKRTLILTNKNIGIKYYWDDSTNKVSINGYSESLNGNGYLIPIESLQHLPTKTYFDEYKASTGVITYATETVTIKWYQTDLFQFVTLAVAMFTFNPEIVALSYIATQIVLSLNISNDLKTALIIGTGIAIGYYQNQGGSILTVDNVSKIVTQLGKYYFTHKTKNIYNNIEQMSKEQQDMEKEISELKKDRLYFPMDSTNEYYDTQFSLLYSFDDLYYNSINEIIINDKSLI